MAYESNLVVGSFELPTTPGAMANGRSNIFVNLELGSNRILGFPTPGTESYVGVLLENPFRNEGGVMVERLGEAVAVALPGSVVSVRSQDSPGNPAAKGDPVGSTVIGRVRGQGVTTPFWRTGILLDGDIPSPTPIFDTMKLVLLTEGVLVP